ncbi:hypothetical protein J3E73DRAFT_375282 [Bipolaris maydis]|nr:hypothetical protein J3E73DRAFT_375282 [Bipolaris maydis]
MTSLESPDYVGYIYVEFAGLRYLLGIASFRDDIDDMIYAATAPSICLGLMQRYGAFNWDAWTNESFVKDDETKRLTYCGYLKFLRWISRIPIPSD